MRKFDITVPVEILSYDEMTVPDRTLADAARKATQNAHAPYSRFHVGAAILLDNGQTICGSNQENAAFPSGTCAERSACFYAASLYPGIQMKKIAIAAWQSIGNNGCGSYINKPISPCGACRQALLEYEHLYGDIEVILCGAEEIYRLPSVSALLPLSFTEF